MAHHSSDQHLNKSQVFNEDLEKMLDASAKSLNLGPTGEFPDGKIADHDEGEIRLAITNYSGRVIFNFGKQIKSLGMTPEQAEAIGYSLIENAAKAKKPTAFK